MTCNQEYIYVTKKYIGDFTRRLNAQRSTSSFCDVVLVAEGVEFPAHRSVLAAGSEYFEVMFKINMAENTQSRIHLVGASSDALGKLLDYIYTGTLCITKESVVNLIFLSTLLMLFDVAECCWKYFVETLDVRNCIERKTLADSIGSEEVANRVTTFVLENFMKLDANSVANCPAEILRELFPHEKLTVEKELDVLHVLLKWITCDLIEREKFAELLLDSVRFGFLSLSKRQLEDTLKSYGILDESRVYELILNRVGTQSGSCEARLSYRSERVIVTVGGQTESAVLCKVSAYVPSLDEWYELSGMNHPRKSFGLVAVNEDLFVVGGTMEKALVRPVPFIERYNIRKNIWEEIYITSTSELERDQAAIVNFRGNIILIGGFQVSAGTVMSSSIQLNPVSGERRSLAALSMAREGHAVVANETNIYVIGGKNESGVLDSVERYDAETETWCTLKSMSTKRHQACAVWFDNQLFVFGGYDGQNVLNSAEVYEPAFDRWQRLPDMATARMKFGISVLDDHAYLIGGMKGSHGPMVSEVEKFSFLNAVWSSVSPVEEAKMEMNCTTIDVLFKFLK